MEIYAACNKQGYLLFRNQEEDLVLDGEENTYEITTGPFCYTSEEMFKALDSFEEQGGGNLHGVVTDIDSMDLLRELMDRYGDAVLTDIVYLDGVAFPLSREGQAFLALTNDSIQVSSEDTDLVQESINKIRKYLNKPSLSLLKSKDFEKTRTALQDKVQVVFETSDRKTYNVFTKGLVDLFQLRELRVEGVPALFLRYANDLLLEFSVHYVSKTSAFKDGALITSPDVSAPLIKVVYKGPFVVLESAQE